MDILLGVVLLSIGKKNVTCFAIDVKIAMLQVLFVFVYILKSSGMINVCWNSMLLLSG